MDTVCPSMLRMIIVGVDMDCKISRKHIMVEGVEFIRNQEDAQDNKQACMAGIRDQWEFSDLNHFKIYRTVLEKCND